MKYCIYLKKTEPEVSFSSEEHIFPAGIGGIQKLPSEYVSHDCNNAFSSMELGFMRESLIALPRQFVGPGKRGKLSTKKATKSKISLIHAVEDPNLLEFGYISLGQSFPISQIRINITGTVQFISSATSGDANKQVADFVTALEKFDKKYAVVKDERFKKDEFLLGIHEGKWYLGLSGEENKAHFEEILQNIIDQKPFENQAPSYATMQPKVNQTLNIDINEYFRVCSKIVFNYLAYIKGQDFVLRECFDPLRNWIVKGGENKFAQMLESPKDIFSKIPFPEDSHKVMILKIRNSLVGYLSFYGGSFQNVVTLCDNFDEPFDEQTFICDWKNRKEFTHVEYLNKLHKR